MWIQNDLSFSLFDRRQWSEYKNLQKNNAKSFIIQSNNNNGTFSSVLYVHLLFHHDKTHGLK